MFTTVLRNRSLLLSLSIIGLFLIALVGCSGNKAPAPQAQNIDPNQPPQIVEISPDIGDRDVDPALTELRVTFDQDMGAGCSWTGGGENFPELTGKPAWTNTRTCVLPVTLKPGHDYRLGLNNPNFKNFQSANGVPLEPVVFTFSTRD